MKKKFLQYLLHLKTVLLQLLLDCQRKKKEENSGSYRFLHKESKAAPSRLLLKQQECRCTFAACIVGALTLFIGLLTKKSSVGSTNIYYYHYYHYSGNNSTMNLLLSSTVLIVVQLVVFILLVVLRSKMELSNIRRFSTAEGIIRKQLE